MKFIKLCVLVILLMGCASNKTYRSDLKSHCVFSVFDESCKSSLEITRDEKIALGYVEINDQGLLRERGQLDRVRQLIGNRGENQTVIVYVHGWHNSADSENKKNVRTFRKLLQKYANLNSSAEVNVTGVYVGWRGDSLLFPSFLSFWNRKDVSIEVGQGALVDVVSTIETASIKAKARMLSIGHSFGGSALFNATKSLFMSRLDNPPIAYQDEKFPMHSAVGDLVLIINPAFEAMQYWPLHSAVKNRLEIKKQEQGIEHNGPRLLIMQGHSDWATRYAFPIGRFVPVLFESHVGDSDSNDGGNISEWDLDRYAIGHFKELNTHDLDITDDDYQINTCGENQEPADFENAEWESQNAKVILKPKSDYIKGSPYWIVYDKVLSQGHNDLDNNRLTCMVADLLTTYTKKQAKLAK